MRPLKSAKADHRGAVESDTLSNVAPLQLSACLQTDGSSSTLHKLDPNWRWSAAGSDGETGAIVAVNQQTH